MDRIKKENIDIFLIENRKQMTYNIKKKTNNIIIKTSDL